MSYSTENHGIKHFKKIGERYEPGKQDGPILLTSMKILKILKDIFLEEDGRGLSPSSPKNLTTHYRGELRHIECDEICT